MNYRSFFRYRSVWMFVSILFVMMFHADIQTGSAFINYFLYFANFSVDIFVLASGIGCYMSYSREQDYGKFLKRRALKILPALMPVLIVWVTVMLVKQKITAISAICNLLGLQMFLPQEQSFNWYISCIFVLYLSAPLFVKLTGKVRNSAAAALCIAVLALLAFPTLSLDLGSGVHLVMLRLPVFFLGMYIAKCSKEHEKIPTGMIVLALALIPVGAHTQIYMAKNHLDYLTNYGLYWYPSALIAPGICVVISFICGLLDRIRVGSFIVKIANTIGGYTLEIYLVHFSILELVKRYVDMRSPGWIKPMLLFNGLVAAAVLALRLISVLVNRLAEHAGEKNAV